MTRAARRCPTCGQVLPASGKIKAVPSAGSTLAKARWDKMSSQAKLKLGRALTKKRLALQKARKSSS